MATHPPRLVIIPPFSSSSISSPSASSGFSTICENRPLLAQRNAQVRANFFEQNLDKGAKLGRQRAKSAERAEETNKTRPAGFRKNNENRMDQGPREYVSCKDIGVDFCARTSSHGIPIVGTHSFFGRPFWAIVTAIAFCSFIIQTYFTFSDYLEYRTIIEMQLKFEPAPFPAITICNLNAFKLSEAIKIDEIKKGLEIWKQALSPLNRLKEVPSRRRPQAVYGNEAGRKIGDLSHRWNPHNYSVYPSTTNPPPSEVEEAFGLEDLKDRGGITTKTKENLIFLVAGMRRDVRQSLSYTLHEFVLRCFFNGKDCDLNRDFQIQLDPEYGNCWTFNFNDSVELKNSRAGPMYGLRLLLNVNQSDYIPTTEAAGVRIVVHDQDHEPFPDTFGYSAPTGFVSSFGLKMKSLHRLDAPYGKCSDTFRPAGYIYAEHHYSPEACYRNCFQHIILGRCACGDPRFPLPNDSEHRPCDVRNPKERACLVNQTALLGGFHHLTHDCYCVQPCTENTFETAYSAAAWPAQNLIIGNDDCSLVLGANFTQAECTEYYRKNMALIEIYYEQLNYEKLKETPAYSLANLLSDLGGNIGLWIGFSLITVLIFECLTFGCKQCVYRPLQKKAQLRNKHDHVEEEEGEEVEKQRNELSTPSAIHEIVPKMEAPR